MRQDPAAYNLDPASGTPYEWAFSHVGLDRALNLTSGDPQVLVGIVDSGWAQIPDEQSKVAESWYYTTEGPDALDTGGHGTFVASIIAAPNDDGYGLAGYCGACRIVPFRVVNLNSFSVSAAIRKLVDEHVRVINLSLGGGPSFVLLDAINYAISKNVLVVASAGNDGASQVSYPAAWLMGENGALGWGLAVGASGRDDARASFSNWGTRLSLVAPGSGTSCSDGIWSALSPIASDFEDGGGCDTVVTDVTNGGKYAYAAGTSFSAPEVAGVAALVMAARPELTSSQVADVIEKSATRPSGVWQPDVGWGVLNAAAALELATGRSSADAVTLGAVQLIGSKFAGAAGSAWARLTWADGVTVSAGTADCTVRIRGLALHALATLNNGTATCGWTVPRGTVGAGSGTIVATDAEGNQTSVGFTFTVLAVPKPAKASKKKR